MFLESSRSSSFKPRMKFMDIKTCSLEVNKQIMAGPKRNNEFCIPETLSVPRGKALN